MNTTCRLILNPRMAVSSAQRLLMQVDRGVTCAAGLSLRFKGVVAGSLLEH